MFTEVVRPTFAVIAIFALLFCTSVAVAEKPEPPDESPSKLAQQVYKSLLDEYRNGETGLAKLELLNNWSTRILHADLVATELGDGLTVAHIAQKAMQSHSARMRGLEEIVEQKVDAGVVRRSDLLAARYFHRLNTSIAQIVKQMQEQLQPPDIELPEVSEARALNKESPTIVIDIDAKGNLSVRGKVLTLDQLNKQLKKVGDDESESATALIRVHPECLYGTVVLVLDACNKAGLSPTFTNVDDNLKKD